MPHSPATAPMLSEAERAALRSALAAAHQHDAEEQQVSCCCCGARAGAAGEPPHNLFALDAPTAGAAGAQPPSPIRTPAAQPIQVCQLHHQGIRTTTPRCRLKSSAR